MVTAFGSEWTLMTAMVAGSVKSGSVGLVVQVASACGP